MKIRKMIIGYAIVCMEYNSKLDPLNLITFRDGKMYPTHGYPTRLDPNGLGFIRPI